MRISTQTITNMTNKAVNNANDLYADVIQKITSNKNFQKISDNVVDSTKVLKLNDQLAKLDQYQSNIQAAMNEMNLAYDTLGSVTDEMNAINELIVEAANATTTPESAKAIADELEQRVASIAGYMNQKYMDNYIFSGTFTHEQTYIADENGDFSYNGSPQAGSSRNLTIADNTTFTYNVTGEEIFGEKGTDEEFFAQMQDLISELRQPELDYEAIRGKLEITETVSKNIVQATGQISAEVSKLEATSELNEETIVTLTEDKVDLEEVDITKAATDLATAQTMLQASYSMSSVVMQSVSLLDYL